MSSAVAPSVPDLLLHAQQARQAGNLAAALAQLDDVLRLAPDHPGALNLRGLTLLGMGRAAEAVGPLRRATTIDPQSPPLFLNLADALQSSGDPVGSLTALDQALERDPYLAPALVRKAQLLEALGRREEALRPHRALLKMASGGEPVPPAFVDAMARARAAIDADGRERYGRLAADMAALGDIPARAHAYVEQLCGLRQVFVQQPTGPHFPFLPAIEFFEDRLFPWFADLEAAFPVIRDELLALWRNDVPGFDPYVRFDPTAPVNQWTELNHSPRWSAFFLWRDGRRVEENIALCPGTAAAIEQLPLLDVPGKSPTVMFSILAPRTRIPAHTGVTNTRTTVHLPLVIPGPCGFRVGGETREWVEGKAWGFDDTIEHEAWNDTDMPRAIMIIDAWNPLLTERERDVVRIAAREMRL